MSLTSLKINYSSFTSPGRGEQAITGVLVTSILGVIGIAFFAGWSLLSNTFAAFLLFYASPFKMEDEITVLDGPNTVTGKVVNMTLFFVFVEDAEGNRVTVPNNIVLQRAVMTRTRKQEA